MKTAIETLFAVLFALVMGAALAGFAGGCSPNDEQTGAELPLACEAGSWIVPADGECLRIVGRFRLGGMQRGACHDVFDELSDATIAVPMVISGEYETMEVDCDSDSNIRIDRENVHVLQR